MSLLLFETRFSQEDYSRKIIEGKIARVESELERHDTSLIEVQIAQGFEHAFFIIDTNNAEQVVKVLEEENISVDLQKEVRLIGESLEDVKRKSDFVNYLVEWNLPEHLTMEQYLARKEKNSVKYAEVPEVSFARTYVCEDMTKCLCFYDAPNQEAVEKAREVVEAPIDAITELNDKT